MYCVKCGKQLPDEARFCHICGTPVPDGASSSVSPAVPDASDASFAPVKPKKKTSPKKLLAVLGILLTIVVLFFAASIISIAMVERISVTIPDPAEYFGVEGEDWRLGTEFYDPESPEMTYRTVEDPKEAVEEYVKLLCSGDYSLRLTHSFDIREGTDEHQWVLDYIPDNGFICFVDRYARALPEVEVAYLGLREDGAYRFDVDISYGGSFVSTGITCGTNFTRPDEVTPSTPETDPAPVPDEEASAPSESSEPSPASSDPPVSSVPAASAPAASTPAAPVISGPVLPDPGAFLGGMSPKENEPGEISGRRVYYKMDIDDGWTAVQEYVDLLGDPRFKLSMRTPAEDENWTTLYLHREVYFFDYTGPETLIPAQDSYYHKDDHNYSADVFVSLSKNGQEEYTAITVCYSNDFTVADLGDRASTASRLSPRGSGSFVSTDSGADYDAEVPCNVCDRSGKCQTCGGDGYLYSSASGKEDRNCYSCNQSGRCTSCGGNGWID